MHTALVLGGVIAYTTAGAFEAVVPGVYNLATGDAGAGGDITVVSTTATNRPFLDNTANR